jgi:hypothetical protein
MSRPVPVDRIADVLAIQALKARYFNALDTKDWASFRDVFTDDLLFWRDTSYAERSVEPITSGADAFVASIRSRHERSVTIHHGHNPEITLTGGRTADGLWSLFDWVDNPEHGHAWQGYGHYTETYELGDDSHWRIRTMRLARLRLVPMEASPDGSIVRTNAAWQAGTLIRGGQA